MDGGAERVGRTEPGPAPRIEVNAELRRHADVETAAVSAVTRQRRRRILDKACSNTRRGAHEPLDEATRVVSSAPATGRPRHGSSSPGTENDGKTTGGGL